MERILESMSRQQHIIKRQIIELEVSNPDDAYRLQVEVSRVYRQRIVSLIDRYCTQLSTPDQIHRIETLELDLGYIDPAQLERDLVNKIARLLERDLTKKIEGLSRQGEGSQADSQLELLTIFARTGGLPWWADASRPRLLEDCVHYLLEAEPLALGRLLQILVGEHISLLRLVTHLGDELLAGLAGALVVARDDAFRKNFEQLVIVLQGTIRAFHRRATWREIFQLSHYAAEAGPQPEAFYRMVIDAVASEADVSFQALLEDVQRQLPAGSSLRRSLETSAQVTTGTAHGEDLPQRLRHLSASAQPPAAALWHLLLRLAPRFTAVARLELLTIIEETPPEDRVEHIRRLLQTALTKGWLSPAAVEPLITDLAEVGVLLSLPPSETAETASNLSFSDVDELYVDNAGLVILWPFLVNFFNRLGLLADKQFQDEEARQRAVGVLQVLATGQATFPEYLLPLNKILSGLEPTELFDFGPALTEAEAGECEDLLRAAIAQAPILKNMSPVGFQGTFLIRSGVLRSRDGAWLLQVERETYDMVLDSFPWSWAWVKLPWMETPLRVEW